MLRLLRLRRFPLSHDENSRNPALRAAAMLISPMKEHKEKNALFSWLSLGLALL
jgi:hypothetical protein